MRVLVYFETVPPLIRISNQMVGVTNGSTAVLECETEAFPEPLRYDTLVSLFTVY